MNTLIYLSLLIPVIVTCVFYLYGKRHFTWWEFFIPIGVGIICIISSKLLIDSFETSYTEYWGSSVVEARYYEPWNEYIQQTCSRTVDDGDGKSHTETYDCSYVSYHSEYWMIITTSKEEINISENKYDSIVNLFGNRSFYDMHRDYYTNDGDMYYTQWDNSYTKNIPITTEHTYTNKIKASDVTLFNIKIITDKEADSLKLFDYPRLDDNFNYKTIIGYNPSDSIQKKFNKLNAIYGPENQLRLWILVFNGGTIQIGLQQENYWVRGNKNELILCFGIDTTTNKINWAHIFSWSPSEDLKIEIRDYINNMGSMSDSTLNNLDTYLKDNLKDYVRRPFKEFEYIRIEPSKTSVIITYIIMLLVSIGINIWIIKNEIE
jgi:hypothetical protein